MRLITNTMRMIQYKLNTASSEQIAQHLWACSPNFIPALSEKVNIEEYAQKLAQRAVNFEAWDGEVLAGMVSAYLNDPARRAGFITNVSTVGGYSGQGIGSTLLRQCIERAQEQGFLSIGLEVNKQSLGAVRLYQKLGFVAVGDTETMLKMNLTLRDSDSPDDFKPPGTSERNEPLTA